jgi:hypothetical protein
VTEYSVVEHDLQVNAWGGLDDKGLGQALWRARPVV